MILATAGHVDHGKSALVAALTGQAMDRLAEERARGMTIDLNFAALALGGHRIGVVDVPGHEDFLRTMAAGAGGADLVLLVVAADEGPKPQTWEHLAVAEYLGVPSGIVAFSKADLVPPERVAEVHAALAPRLAASPIRFAPALAVSARTGDGLDRLRQGIERQLGLVAPRDAADGFRMPIDRAFSVRGTGTVITGSVWSGSVGVGDQLRFLPSGHSGRVRGIEVLGEARERASAGERAALAIVGVRKEAVPRGEVALDDSLPWEPVAGFEAQASLLPAASAPLESGARLHLHIGTAACTARIRTENPISPGGDGAVRLRLDRPVVVRGGDRFLLRTYSPVSTIGGGFVVDPFPEARRRPRPSSGNAPIARDHLDRFLAAAPPVVEAGRLALRSGMPRREVERRLAAAGHQPDSGGAWIDQRALQDAAAAVVAALTGHHARSPGEPGLHLETVRRLVGQPAAVMDGALERLRHASTVTVEAGLVRLAGFVPIPAVGSAELERILAALETAGPRAPAVPELESREPGLDVRGALRLAAEQGRVEAVRPDWYLSSAALAGFRRHLAEEARNGDITIASLKGRTGLSRKYLVPLLEWADRRGVTRRIGNVRRLV